MAVRVCGLQRADLRPEVGQEEPGADRPVVQRQQQRAEGDDEQHQGDQPRLIRADAQRGEEQMPTLQHECDWVLHNDHVCELTLPL